MFDKDFEPFRVETGYFRMILLFNSDFDLHRCAVLHDLKLGNGIVSLKY